MKTKSYNVYSFSELSPKARERAIEQMREHVIRVWNGDATIEDAKQAFAHAGFNIERVHYSGFSCQGDGASFTGSWRAADVNVAAMREYAPKDEELHRIAEGFAAITNDFPEASFTVKQSGHYMHEYCTDFSFVVTDNEGNDIALSSEAEDALIGLARDAMRWTYRQLEREYDWETADAQVVEAIEGNDYEFTEEGKID